MKGSVMKMILFVVLATQLSCSSSGSSTPDGGGEDDVCEVPEEGPYGVDCGSTAVCGSEFVIDGPASLSQLAGVTYVRGDLTISSHELSSLSALSDLRCVEGWVYFREYGSLQNLEGLENLRSVGADLCIGEGNESDGENGYLTDLSGLSNLRVVGTYLKIRGQHELTDLSGLGSLESLDDLLIEDNPMLESLQGPSSLKEVSRYFMVMNNASLPTCEATELRDNLIDEGFDGIVCIQQNLEDACGNQVDDECF